MREQREKREKHTQKKETRMSERTIKIKIKIEEKQTVPTITKINYNLFFVEIRKNTNKQ